MQALVLFLCGLFVFVENAVPFSQQNTAYGYMKNIGIPLAEKIRKAEESSRIIGGVPAALGQYPYQAGLLGEIVVDGGAAGSVCGGTLVSASRVLTAAHCWFDGVHQAWRVTVVLGSVLLFSGGTRVQTSAVAVHPNWNPGLIRNDLAVVYLPGPVALSGNIAPISLPSGSELFESFAGVRAIAVGYGITSEGAIIEHNQSLNHVSLLVLTSSECSTAFPLIAQPSNICTSGLGTVGFCDGDSGGPLILIRNNKHTLIGVSSFRSSLGCESNRSNVYSRITSFMGFINQHI
ncbi:unnamed protein product [Chrysodeixis includens]|uniref:Peptidase S1 domain-containing protein n=1 Tax=Chrysodeixis includens TaxID=689277 RepID=A0A9P0BW76_CHRIL|nr:unnamed protein product [Chrysodeixis includens]